MNLTVEGDSNGALKVGGGEDVCENGGPQSSLRDYLTREALPNAAYYRNLHSVHNGPSRPSLDYLHENGTIGDNGKKSEIEGGDDSKQPKKRGKIVKFGWMEGVLMPCLLNIWGVMLFLRLSWVVGEAGIIYGSLIVILANSITVITTLSMSAVATNGEIKGGGIYYMISRSLGPEYGGSIGLMFTMANSIAAATYVIGFVNSLQDMMKDYFALPVIIPGTGGGTNDVRIIGTITLLLLLVPAIVGMDWVNRVQKILLFILIGSQVNFLVGVVMGPQSDTERAQGFLGLNGELFKDSMKTDYRYYEGNHEFFTVFGVFFPAVTGIVAGANLSGDLKDPCSAIPKGTILAIFITFLTYVIYPVFVGAGVTRHASGNVTEYLYYKERGLEGLDNPIFNATACGGLFETGQSMCKYGSQNNFQVIELMSAWGPLIYIGCFAATLSSAIASLVGAPRVLQALAKDKLYPHIHVFAQGVGANNDPFRGYILVSVISFACIMLGQLNAVSSLLTNCFLASYGFINFSCFHASFAKSPGWRPSFKYYNLWLSLIGSFLCAAVMILIDWPTALITFIIALFLYKYVAYRKPDVNWGSSTQAQTYNSALRTCLDLIMVEEHVKNYRPQVLLLCGPPWTRPSLLDFGNLLTKGVSLLSCANIVEDPLKNKHRMELTKKAYGWLSKHKIRAFYTLMEAKNIEEGARTLLQTVGLGKLRPNILLLGYKSNWRTCSRQELKAYFNTLHESLNMHFGLTILRVQRGFDFSHILKDDSSDVLSDGVDNIGFEADVDKGDDEKSEGKKEKPSKKEKLYVGIDGKKLPKNVLNEVTMFQSKHKGTIDVWWLYDDGGLTVLLPYILSLRRQWAGCRIRIFVLSTRNEELELEQRSMINLLSKFRIDFSDITIIPDISKKASDIVENDLNNLIEQFKKTNDLSDEENEGVFISETELLSNREKTNRHLRLRELLLENSKDSSLVVMTLPIPRKNSVSASLYMAWLETLSKDMPPFLFIRGNQTSVLTYYS